MANHYDAVLLCRPHDQGINFNEVGSIFANMEPITNGLVPISIDDDNSSMIGFADPDFLCSVEDLDFLARQYINADTIESKCYYRYGFKIFFGYDINDLSETKDIRRFVSLSSMNKNDPCTITNVYDFVATEMGYDKDEVTFDCKNIEVSEYIVNEIMKTLKKSANKLAEEVSEYAASAMLIFGPKCKYDLDQFDMEIHDGFIQEIQEGKDE